MKKLITTLGIAFLLGTTLTGCNIDKGEIGVNCNVSDDCKSGFCKNNSCAPPDFCAQNGQKDGNETAIDCGGIFCVQCGAGLSCLHGSDCLSGTCLNNTCTNPLDAGTTTSLDGSTASDGGVSMVDSSTAPSPDLVVSTMPDLLSMVDSTPAASPDLIPPCGMTLCASKCIDTSSDSSNCGGCGKACGGGQTCSNGACSCFVGELFCLGKCTNTLSDANNCGGCAKRCQPGEVCSAGMCEVQCGKPSIICNGNACVDVVHDPRHCGGCNAACSSSNMASVTCQTFCNGSCKEGFSDCDGDKLGNGCEVNLTNDPKHCGDCATVCPIRQNSTPACGKGLCSVTCFQNFGDCDWDETTGCETDVLTDKYNCGACNNWCFNGFTCENGKCVVSCPQGQTRCNGSCFDTQTNASNCGACGNVCPQGQTCTAGQCMAPPPPQTLYIEAEAVDQVACGNQLIVVAFGPNGEKRSLPGQPLSIVIDNTWGGFLYYSTVCNGAYANWNQMADRTPVVTRFKSVKLRGKEFVNSSTVCPDVVSGGKKPTVMMDGSPPC